MKRILYLLVLLFPFTVLAQDGTLIDPSNSQTRQPSAAFEVYSTNQGFLAPRVALTSTSDAATITGTEPNGLMVYNTATAGDVTPGFYYWNGSAWSRLINGSFTGSGTTNYLARWTPNGNTLGIGATQDDGTQVGIGTAPVSGYRLIVGPPAGANVLLINDINTAEWQIKTGGYDLSFANDYDDNGTYDTRLFLSQDGNVGVGNTAPGHQLSAGEATSDGQAVTVRGYSNAPGSWKGGGAFGYSSANVIMGQLSGVAQIGGHNGTLTAWADLGINVGGGNVGIGTAGPSSKLDVQNGHLTVGSLYGPYKMNGTLGSFDTRSTNPTPETYQMGVVSEFKGNGSNGLSDGGSYNSVLSVRQWSSGTDWSGGGTHQLGLTQNGNMWHRYSQTTGAWGAWRRFLYTTDIPGGVLPTGSNTNTLYHNGTSWVAGSNLANTGSEIKLGQFTTGNTDEWPFVTWLRPTPIVDWDEGLIKGSSSRGAWGRAGFGIHMHSSRHFGFYSSGWDALFDIEGGTGRAYIKGNTGIGNTTPGSRLHVTSGTSGVTDYGILTVGEANGNNSTQRGISFGYDATNEWAWMYARTVGCCGRSININNTAWVQASGNVGIGTSSPAQAIEIYRDNADAGIRFHDPGDYHYAMGIDRSDAGKFKINYGAGIGDANHVTMTTGGNVGIGTNNPIGKLHVGGAHANGVMSDGNDRPSIASTGHYPQMVMMAGGTGNTSHGASLMIGSYDSGTSGNHKHWSIGSSGQNSTFLDIGYHNGTDLNPHAGIRNYNGSTFMTINNSGYVGINQLNPGGRLHAVNSGGEYMIYNTSGNLQVYEAESTGGEVRIGAAWNKPGIYTSNSWLYVSSEGGIAINDNNQENWYFDGDNFYSNGWGHIYTSSSNLHLDSYSGNMYLNYYYNDWVRIGNGGTGYSMVGNYEHFDNDDWIYNRYAPNDRVYFENRIGVKGQIGIAGNPWGWPDAGCANCGDVINGSPNLWLDASDGRMLFRARANSKEAYEFSMDNNGTYDKGVVPTNANYGELGTTGRYWWKVHSGYFRYKHYWDDYEGFDTYDDLAELRKIKMDTVWDPYLNHHVGKINYKSIPEFVKNYEDEDDPEHTFIDVRRMDGFLMGVSRQLDRETIERDKRLAERTEILAEALGVDFKNAKEITELTKKVEDHGNVASRENRIDVAYNTAFQQQIQNTTVAVNITPTSDYIKFYVAAKSAKGFTVAVEKNPEQSEFSFDWIAVAHVNSKRENVNEIDKVDDVFYRKPIVVTGEHPVNSHDKRKYLESEEFKKDQEASKKLFDETVRQSQEYGKKVREQMEQNANVPPLNKTKPAGSERFPEEESPPMNKGLLENNKAIKQDD